jgi:hypothetical protein
VSEEERRLSRAYEAFNARDIDAALALTRPDVDWQNGMEGGREHGHEAVRVYWTRQFGLIDSHIDPVRFSSDEAGRTVVDVHQIVRDLQGELLSEGDVQHVFTFRDGKIARMDIREP